MSRATFDHEPGADGRPQAVLPGVPKTTLGERLQMLAEQPKRAGRSLAARGRIWAPTIGMPAGGLFDEDARNQRNLF